MAATHLIVLLSLLSLSLYPNLSVAGAPHLTTSTPTTAVSSGYLLLTTPIPFLTPASFSTQFSFSLSPNSSISLLLLPSKTLDSPQNFAIEFRSNSVRIGNISCPNFIPIGNQEKLHAFVDYRAASSQLEVRLGTVGKPKPHRPLLDFPITFFQIWGEAEILVVLGTTSNADSEKNNIFLNPIPKGLHSIPVDPRAYELKGRMRSKNMALKKQEVLVDLENLANGELDQVSSVVYSWHFRAKSVPKGLHSMPVDPRVHEHRYRSGPCYLTVVSALMIAVGCCAFVVFMVMFFKVVCTDWDEVLELEYTLKPVKSGYEMVSVDVENNQFGNVKC